MPDEIVIRCCAPTLAAIKTGSLFNYPFESREDMTASLRAMNRCLLRKGVCALPLRYQEGKALIYLYRPAMLDQNLSDSLEEDILKETVLCRQGLSECGISCCGRKNALCHCCDYQTIKCGWFHTKEKQLIHDTVSLINGSLPDKPVL